jgi:predicted amidohydrolase YtcJ
LENNAVPPADLILTGGRVWTSDPRQPEVEAIAVVGDRIAAAGTTLEIEALGGPETRRIDLAGRRLLPGFNDAHVHLYHGGESLACVQLREARGPQQVRDRIAAFAATLPRGEWILNGSWDQESWDPPTLPDHHLISDVTPYHPVCVNRSDGHMVLVNELAMRLAGVDRGVADIPGGEIGRDADGNLTGIFKDAAKALIERVIPQPSRERIRSAILAAQAHTAENGVTSVQDMGVLGAEAADRMSTILSVYEELHAANQLRLRISAHIPLAAWRRIAGPNRNNTFLRTGGLKSFSDGSLGSVTAWFWDPYTDVPQTCGLPSDELADVEAWYAILKEADRAGLQLVIHAIGDRANTTVLDSLERLAAENGARDRRARIEHAQHLRPQDLDRFAKLNVIASMQPYHAIDDGRWAERRVGVERTQTTYAFRSLLDSGATVVFGSDWWVAPISPILGIYAAVTRRTLDDAHPNGWIPQQKVTVAEAVHAYTAAAAYASGEEHQKGSIEPGKLADFVVLSDDVLTVAPETIRDIQVDMTILGGDVIYSRHH